MKEETKRTGSPFSREGPEDWMQKVNDEGISAMKAPRNIDVLFVAGFGPIVRDPAASRKFYSETLGLPFK